MENDPEAASRRKLRADDPAVIAPTGPEINEEESIDVEIPAH